MWPRFLANAKRPFWIPPWNPFYPKIKAPAVIHFPGPVFIRDWLDIELDRDLIGDGYREAFSQQKKEMKKKIDRSE